VPRDSARIKRNVYGPSATTAACSSVDEFEQGPQLPLSSRSASTPRVVAAQSAESLRQDARRRGVGLIAFLEQLAGPATTRADNKAQRVKRM
jgi:hypothetical protein